MIFMKRLVFILFMIVLIALAAYYLFYGQSTLNPLISDFTLKNPSKVNRISLADQHNNLIILKTEEGWESKGEKISTRKSEEVLILAGLVETIAPAPVTLIDSITAYLKKGITISFYQDKKKITSYQLCKYNKALYARKPRSEMIFKIAVRGYQNTDLLALMSLNLKDWKENIIIDLMPDEIKTIIIRFPNTEKAGFKLIVDSMDIPQIYDLKGVFQQDLVAVSKVKQYLHFFSGIRYYPTRGIDISDSIVRQQVPFCELRITSHDSDVIDLSFYRRIDKETGQPDPYEFITLLPDVGVVLLKYSDFDPIMVELGYFLKN